MKRLAAVALFLGAAGASFALTAPGDLVAAVQTQNGAMCPPRYRTNGDLIGYYGDFRVGTAFPTSALYRAYFDFFALTDNNVGLDIYKWSYTGASYRDYKTVATTKHSKYDSYVDAVNVKTAPSHWDSVYTVAQCASFTTDCISMYGMSLSNNL